MPWLLKPARRPDWYDPVVALQHAGQLADTPGGRSKYLDYLAWLAEDEPAQKQMRFAEMNRGWLIGPDAFAKAMLREHEELAKRAASVSSGLTRQREEIWEDLLIELLHRLGHRSSDLPVAARSADWKLAVAAALKARTTVTNRWLGERLVMGSRFEVSRNVAKWARDPDPGLARKLNLSTNPKA
jgi:hypothetical protein